MHDTIEAVGYDIEFNGKKVDLPAYGGFVSRGDF